MHIHINASEAHKTGTHSTFVHIGLPKTATSMLQTALFPQHSQIEYLGKYIGRRSFYRDAAVKSLMRGVLTRPSKRVDLGRLVRIFQRDVLGSLQEGKVLLWSSEDLTGGGPKNRQARANNLRTVFGDCKIIIAIRHPLSFVRSMYFQRLRVAQTDQDSWPSKPGRFFDPEWWVEKNWERPHKADLSYLAYADAIEIFAKAFGKDSLGIFLFEELVEDQNRFVGRLCDFIGIDPAEGIRLCERKVSNPQLTEEQVRRIKAISNSWVNSLFFRLLPWRVRKRLSWLASSAQGPKAKFSLSEQWRFRIEESTRKGNRRLIEEWGLPLERFDYPL